MPRIGHTPIPRYTAHPGPALLSQGFRPFFLAAGLWAALFLPASAAIFAGALPPPVGDVVSWHFHEMLYGFVGAALTGFLLTAIPNWTGRMPLQGRPLLALVLLWLAGRVAMAAQDVLGATATAGVDVAFWIVLGGVCTREVVAGRNWRNLTMVSFVWLLAAADLMFHAAAGGLDLPDGLPRRLAVSAAVGLLVLVGGRVVPSFTRNWLAKREGAALPKSFDSVDRVALAATAAALAAWTALPDRGVTAALLSFAAVFNLLRVLRWRGHAVLAEPLLWILHVGYLWVPLGLGLLAAARLFPDLSESDALHALTAGAMGSMTLAMMTRATLAHTGRALHAGYGLAAVYGAVIAAAALRVAAPAFAEPAVAVDAAAALWTLGFSGFVLICGPMLATRRAR